MSIESAIEQLKPLLGERINTTHSVRMQHAQNEAHFDTVRPDAVVFAQSCEDVSTLLRICHQAQCPVTAWGTGTALEGHSLAIHGGICLNMMAMDQIKAIHPQDQDVVVQPGVTREQLNHHLRSSGLFFSVDPGANASLGGMAATRASGTTSLRYGTMRDNVRALEVVLANGDIIRTGSRAKKSAAGYDLTGLFIGSEGTLGIITELTLRLHGTPDALSAATCAFDSLEGAIDTVVSTIQMGIQMARMELVEPLYIEAVNQQHGLDLPLQYHLFLEFHGTTAAVAEQAELLAALSAENGGNHFAWKTRTEERNQLWAARHAAYTSLLNNHPGCHCMTTDTCVPISELAKMVRLAKADIDASSITGAVIGHVGDGNFHTQLLLRKSHPEDLLVAKDIAEKMARRALEVGGTITGEHGIGMGKLSLMAAEHGQAWDLMGQIKNQLDPQNILNPGKLIRQ